MTQAEARPTLAAIREQARACGITIAAEREEFVLADAQHLDEAARRLDRIAKIEEPKEPE
ncbi:hypothetical protein [Shinella sp. BYT-45]|uniref:hypothetical protein n=1 Tax=Shinella sp. BYT-45 TaxID=3377377 RepID=UPI0039818242